MVWGISVDIKVDWFTQKSRRRMEEVNCITIINHDLSGDLVRKLDLASKVKEQWRTTQTRERHVK